MAGHANLTPGLQAGLVMIGILPLSLAIVDVRGQAGSATQEAAATHYPDGGM
jgi:hypothetical protein